mgnify:FL=1
MENKSDQKFGPPKKYTSPDGTVRHVWNGKLHNWDGPAYIPNGDLKKAEYYLNGIKYTKLQWEETIKNTEGLPWYKSSGAIGTSRF